MNDDLYQALKSRISGEVRFDRASRLMYSTDASIYEIEPIGVVIPRTHEDVFATMEVARDFKVPILPRGAGTSLARKTVGEGRTRRRSGTTESASAANGISLRSRHVHRQSRHARWNDGQQLRRL